VKENNPLKARAGIRQRIVISEVSEEYELVPIRVEKAPASEQGQHALLMAVSRPRCGRDALKTAEPAPPAEQMIRV
jgi:hypothetical protein